MAEHRLARSKVGGLVGIEEVDAGEPVHLEIHETRSGESAPPGRGHADLRHHGAIDRDVAFDDTSIDERRCDAEP
ncbi:MAG: hypothetical protein PVI35_06250, partial [Acidimicrobiia bacterium]